MSSGPPAQILAMHTYTQAAIEGIAPDEAAALTTVGQVAGLLVLLMPQLSHSGCC